MKRVMAALAGTLLTVAAVPLAASSAHASCVAPEIAVTPTTVVAGGSTTVTGHSFMATCNDVSIDGESPPKAKPAKVTVGFTQDGRTVTLAKVTASAKYRIDETVTIPRWAEPGRATIDANGGSAVTVTVAAPPTTPPAPPTTPPAAPAPELLAATGAPDAIALTALSGLALMGAGFVLMRRTRRPLSR